MQTHRPILTQHRRQRLVLWALTLLSWMSAMLLSDSAVAPRRMSQRMFSLPWLTDLVGNLLFVRAVELARLRQRKRPVLWRHGRDRRRAHFMRSMLGARLRRRLKHKTARLWAANLIAVVRNLDAHATALARRMRRGFTRLWRTWDQPVALAATMPDGPSSSLAFSNTS